MAPLSILVAIAVLPVILICLFVYSKDRDKEPLKLLIKLFFLGILSCVIVLLLSFIDIPFLPSSTSKMNLFQLLFYSFINIALVEEFFKWIMVYLFGYRSKYFDQLYDVVVYAVFVSLGFAFLENLFYVIIQGTLKIGIIRAFLAVPGHACDAIFMGYYFSLARIYKYKNKKLMRLNIVLSLLVPTLLHGIYDFCLFVENPLLVLVFFMFVTLLYVFSLNKLSTVSKDFIRDN